MLYLELVWVATVGLNIGLLHMGHVLLMLFKCVVLKS